LVRLDVELLLERLEGLFERGLFDELMLHLLTGAVQSEIYAGGKVQDDDLIAEVAPYYVVTEFNPRHINSSRAENRVRVPSGRSWCQILSENEVSGAL